MPIDNQRLFENRAIVGYIDKSIRNEYIKLSKKRDKIKLNEMKLLYVHYLSVTEVADYMKISRQAVNQAKNR